MKKSIANISFPSRLLKIAVIAATGLLCGLGLYAIYASRALSYLSDEPATCVNCHIMAPFYATWTHSSHSQTATCNECHVPQNSLIRKWYFKGKDGLRHAWVFSTRGEEQVLQAIDESATVIMENCIRCHFELNREVVKTGRVDFNMTKLGEGKVCWDCHRHVPHKGTNSLSSTPNALIPYPSSATPAWLKKILLDK